MGSATSRNLLWLFVLAGIILAPDPDTGGLWDINAVEWITLALIAVPTVWSAYRKWERYSHAITIDPRRSYSQVDTATGTIHIRSILLMLPPGQRYRATGAVSSSPERPDVELVPVEILPAEMTLHTPLDMQSLPGSVAQAQESDSAVFMITVVPMDDRWSARARTAFIRSRLPQPQ